MIKIEKSIESIEKGQASDRSKIDDLEQRLQDVEKQKQTWADVASAANKSQGAQIPEKNVLGRVLLEIDEIEQKKQNLVIHRLHESIGETNEAKTEQDITTAIKLINSIVPESKPITSEDIVYARRIGRRPDADAKPRPLVVRLTTQLKRDLIMSNAPKLHGINRISPDLTKAERANEETFFKNLQALKSSGNGKTYKVVGPPGYRKVKEEKA